MNPVAYLRVPGRASLTKVTKSALIAGEIREIWVLRTTKTLNNKVTILRAIEFQFIHKSSLVYFVLIPLSCLQSRGVLHVTPALSGFLILHKHEAVGENR
jgi:hypothetical protein